MKRRINHILSAAVVVVCGLVIVGCGRAPYQSAPVNSTNGAAPVTAEAPSGAPSEADAIKESLAKLSSEDRAAAEKQAVCPVSDAKLGTMGPPKKIDVKGQAVWICCEGCREDLLAKSDEFLAKLKK